MSDAAGQHTQGLQSLGLLKRFFAALAFCDVGDEAKVAFYTVNDNPARYDVGIEDCAVLSQAGNAQAAICLTLSDCSLNSSEILVTASDG